MNRSATFPLSFQRVIDAAESSGIHSPRQAAEVLRSSGIQAQDLLPWATFDHSVRDSYGRRAVSVGDCYELMVMSWNSGDFSAIHDHGNTQWGAVMYFGEAEHAAFRLSEGRLTTKERTLVSAGDINEVDHDLIHQMGNPNEESFMTLHLYGCEAAVDGITGDARIFDLLNGEVQTTDGGVFYCLPDELINQRLPGVTADRETTREHHQQMLDRVLRIQSSSGQYDRKLDHIADRLRGELGEPTPLQ